jgi:hypothetical protein
MNMLIKTAIAGALALGATGAYALGIPATDSSDLVLVIQNTATPANVYVLDTGISINSAFSGTLVSGATLDTSLAGINATIAASATLQSFLAANPAASDGWTIESAQYSGASAVSSPTNQYTKNAGAAKAVFTSVGNAFNISQIPLLNFQGMLGGIQGDLTQPADGLGLSPLMTQTESSTGASLNAQAASKYQTFTNVSDLGAMGSTALTLYGYTGNGGTGQVQSYILGSATLASNGTLTLTGNAAAPVPLPAAVWLFGSGLMGLVGVSRRRKAAV